MFHFIDAVAIAPALAGVGTLLASLQPLRQVISELPAGSARRPGCPLGALTLFFVAGYLANNVVS